MYMYRRYTCAPVCVKFCLVLYDCSLSQFDLPIYVSSVLTFLFYLIDVFNQYYKAKFSSFFSKKSALCIHTQTQIQLRFIVFIQEALQSFLNNLKKQILQNINKYII